MPDLFDPVVFGDLHLANRIVMAPLTRGRSGPKGIPNDRLAVVLDIMAHVLTPKMQAYSYDEGYLYPGPAVKNVPLSLAPKRSQEVIAEFGRPEYADLIAKNPIELPLKPDKMVVAFRMWDEQVGGAKRK